MSPTHPSRGARIDRFALLVSLVVNAPVLAGVAFALLFAALRPDDGYGLAVAVGFATALPLAVVLGLTLSGILPDVFASTLPSRRWPLAGAAAAYGAGWVALRALHEPGAIAALMLTYTVNTLAFLLLSVRWKPSVHASGVSGPATWVALALGPPGLLLYLLLVPVVWARLRLRAHTPGEVAVGALLTVALTALQFRAYVVGLGP